MSRTRVATSPVTFAVTVAVTFAVACTLILALPGIVAPSYAADRPVRIPGKAWITITGHGYGHGHGMSQYGAEGAARRGLSAQQVINFYYPGTRSARLKGHITVHITADDDNDTVVLPRAGLRVRVVGTDDSWILPASGASKWRLGVGAGGASQVSYREGGSWHRWRVLGSDGAFTARGKPVTLVTPSGQVQYRGTLRSLRPSSGSRSRDTVNFLRLDDYLKGVVPLEMPASWSPAAVQAQSIAARTYAAYGRAHPLTDTYQICDTTSCQVYGGYSERAPRLQRCDRRYGREDPDVRRRPGLHPVLLEQRRLDLCRQRALSGREGGSLRRLVGQPDAHLVGPRGRQGDREALVQDRQPEGDPGDLPRR